MDGPEPEAPGGSSGRRAVLLAVGASVIVLAIIGAAIALSGGSGKRETGSVRTGTVQTTTTAPAAPAGAGPPARAAPSTERFGINVNRLFDDRTYFPRQVAAQLRALHATGATVARSDALWEAAEPTAPAGGVHRYDWSFDDAIAGTLAEHGLQWLPIIDYTAPWAQSVAGVDHSPPASAGDYAAYAGAVAARYGAGGAFWREHPDLTALPVDTYEIWNEPDNQVFWRPTPDAGRYADLYATARNAIAAVDPKAAVIVGGLAHIASFLPAMLTARPDLRGHIDGIGLHPYGANPFAVLANVVKARRVLAAVGLDAVPLYITEVGWTTDPPSNPNFLPERLRPGYITSTLAALGHLNCGVAATVFYTWVTPERDPHNGEDWFGIHGPAGAGTPDSAAFAEGLRRATAPAAPIRAC
jgi:polysaccharide biosynthesis protein PslG